MLGSGARKQFGGEARGEGKKTKLDTQGDKETQQSGERTPKSQQIKNSGVTYP